MTRILHPRDLNASFAERFNARDLAGLLALYEPHAVHHDPRTQRCDVGRERIEASLRALLALEGRMTSTNHFCIIAGDIALLRADWSIADRQSRLVASGSSAEIARRQPDGAWLSLIDHPVGASQPRLPDGPG